MFLNSLPFSHCTGQAGPTCVTSNGFLGNCVSSGSCRVGGATSGSCPRSTVCCLRVSSSSNVRTSQPAPQRPAPPPQRPAPPPQRPAPPPQRPAVRPAPPQRRLCLYRRPVTAPAPNLGLLARSARGRRSPQRSRFNRRRLSQASSALLGLLGNRRPTTPRPTVGVQFAIGSPVSGSQGQGAGIIGTRPPRPRVNLNNVLSRISRPGANRRTPVVTNRPPVTRPVVVTSRPAATRRPVIVTNRPTVTQYETYTDYC